MSDLFLKALINFTTEAVALARTLDPQEGDHEELDELDRDCKVNWDWYTEESKWQQLKETVDGNVTTRVYGGTVAWMPGYLRVDQTARNGQFAFEVFIGEEPDDYKAPGCLDPDEEDDDDYDSRYDRDKYAYFVESFPERIERAMFEVVRKRPIIPGAANGPTLPPPDEYVAEEIPKPAEFGDWA